MLVARAFLQLGDERRSELRARLTALLEEYGDAEPGGRTMEIALALFTTERQA